MKLIKYFEKECGTILILPLEDVISSIEGFFDYADPGDKINLEMIEMSEEEYKALPESSGC
jgi:hypothetical protein